MAKLTPESFLNVVKQSKLLTKEKIRALIPEMESAGVDLSTTSTIASWLVGKGHLTEWQVDKLKQARHKGFFLGKYRLLHLLGKGGMSSVYLAEHTLMRRRCAVKVLPIKKVHDSSYLARFHREAQAVASLDHPNIVRAYDIDHEVDKDQEIHFLVMEYVKGHSLQELIASNGPLPFEVAVDYCRQAALGLDHAHRSGLIHRDVKPANLLVDESGVVKVLDLGLALFSEVTEEKPSLTIANDEKVLGTADYLSPEQALDSHKVDARADIYSLGCTMYFMLTGHPPFSEGSIAQRLMWHQTKEPPALTDSRSDTPAPLAELIRRMMKKSPDDRFQSMAELATSLQGWLDSIGNSEEQASRHKVTPQVVVPVLEFPSFPVFAAESLIDDEPLPGAGSSIQSDSQIRSDPSFNAFLQNLDSTAPAKKSAAEAPPSIQPAVPVPTAATVSATKAATANPAPPVAPPVARPLAAPGAPPVAAPVAPPVARPIAAPVAPPVAAPVAPPVPARGVPIAAPVAPTRPVAAAIATPVGKPPVAVPVAKPIVATATVVPTAVPQSDAAAQEAKRAEAPAQPTTKPFKSETHQGGATADDSRAINDDAEEAPLMELEPFDEAESDVDFGPASLDDDSKIEFPSLFGGSESVTKPDSQVTISDAVVTSPLVVGIASRYDDATIITPPEFSSGFPQFPAQADSSVPIVSATGLKPAVPVRGPGTALPIAPAKAVVPPQAMPVVGTPYPAPSGPPLESNDFPNFANFGAAESVGTGPFGQPVGQNPPLFFTPGATANAHQDSASDFSNQVPSFGPASGFEAAAATSEFAARPVGTRDAAARGKAKKQKLPILELVGGLVIAAVAVGGYFVFTGGNEKKPTNQQQSQDKTKSGGATGNLDSTSSGSSGALKTKLEVGPLAEYKSIGEALARIKKDNLRYTSLPRRGKIMIEVASGATLNESISIDNSGGNYPRGIHIVGQGDRANLKGSGSGPAVRLQGLEFFGLENFNIDAGGSDVGIEIAGFMIQSKLLGLTISGYKQNGLLGKGVAGVSTEYVELENLEFKPAGGSSNAMQFTNGLAPTGRVRIKGCKFFGPTSCGINLDVGVNYFEIRECMFEKSSVGLQLGKAAATWKNIILTNNTFYQGKIGIAFGSMPATGSSDFAAHRNLFAGLSGPELVIQEGFDDKKFDSVISTAGGGGIELNFSDRAGQPDIAAGERDIVIFDERRVGPIAFFSTTPSSEEFLATRADAPFGRIDAPKLGSKPYVGAVAPR